MKDNVSIELAGELAAAGAKFNAIELHLPDSMSEQEWAAVGRQLCRTDKILQWWLGDWAAFGLGDPERKENDWRKYGALKKFAEANGMNYQTLRNLAWVSQKVELSRRRDNVPWSTHGEVAALPPKEQTKWLAKVEKESLPRVEVRRQIRQAQGKHNALVPDGPIVKFISKSCDDLAGWLKSQPGDFWTPDRKAIWKKRLAPIVEFARSLG